MIVVKFAAIILTGIIGLPLMVLLGELMGRFFNDEIFPAIRSMVSGYIDSWKHVWQLCTGTRRQGGDKTVKYFYLSLTRGLSGYYVKFEAETIDEVRQHADKYFGRMHGTVYTDAYFHEVVRHRYPNATRVINNKRPIKLTGEPGEWD